MAFRTWFLALSSARASTDTYGPGEASRLPATHDVSPRPSVDVCSPTLRSARFLAGLRLVGDLDVSWNWNKEEDR